MRGSPPWTPLSQLNPLPTRGKGKAWGQINPADSYRTLLLVQHRLEPIEQLPLRLVDLLACGREVEPGGAIDLGKMLALAASRRPFDLERIARDRVGVHVELCCIGLDDLGGALADPAERLQL